MRNTHRPAEFDPGLGAPTRFAFFGEPPVPVLCAAASQEASAAETVLHQVPLHGGQVSEEDYLDRIMTRLTCSRPLTLEFCGPGLRKLRITARDLTDTDPSTYRQTAVPMAIETVAWAQAAWRHTGCDGILWMSRHWNTDKAVVLFGDRVAENELNPDPAFARAFINPTDLEWLASLCERVDVGFAPPG